MAFGAVGVAGQEATAQRKKSLSILRCLAVPELSQETYGHQINAYELQHQPHELVCDTEHVKPPPKL